MIYKLLTVIEPVLYAKFVKRVAMTEQRESRNTFRNCSYALHATDVTFQPAYRPSGQFAEQKNNFSGKYIQADRKAAHLEMLQKGMN
ncbi:hypothetical protein PR001_g350 [Phytophthora rubi]|nr:hypothetical protein PR001_g350 [Phytophthora rubi]